MKVKSVEFVNPTNFHGTPLAACKEIGGEKLKFATIFLEDSGVRVETHQSQTTFSRTFFVPMSNITRIELYEAKAMQAVAGDSEIVSGPEAMHTEAVKKGIKGWFQKD